MFKEQYSKLNIASGITQHSKLKNAKSSIERFYYEQCNETEMVVMKAGRDTSGIIMNKWLINQIDIKCRH